MAIYPNIQTVQQAIRDGDTTLEGVVNSYLDQIKATQDLNIYVEVYQEEAIAQARKLDAKFKSAPESVGRLYGMILSIKDVICHAEHGVTAGSKILSGFNALFSATAVERLLAEDAIIIGRVNCDEFAMGSSNETSHYGPVRNAADPTKIPGGSSGGSAVAVQADTCLASIGSDTGGSVRQPAAFCGVIGVKPTYGRISRWGLLAYASSFDQIGILSKSVPDAAILLEVMAGPDNYDSTASSVPVPPFSQQLDFPGSAKIAYYKEALNGEGLAPEIKQATEAEIDRLRTAGHTVEAVDFPLLPYLVPAYYVMTTAEASTNLSRYDGIRYGYRSDQAHDLLSTYQRSRTEGFGSEVKRRILLGTFVLSSGYYDAYYGKAQQVRRLIQEATLDILKTYDFILSPASPVPPWDLGTKMDDPVAVYLSDIFTVQANMVGIPAISIPIGKTQSNLPIGLQIMSGKFEEGKLLAFAQRLTEGNG